MKHEYLIDLLKTNKTVIIPNIGAISNNDSPDHKYLFNEYLKFNDGMIVKYISSKEGKSMDEAGDDLDKFTQGFADLLNQGKEVVIPQVGIIAIKDGKAVFTCDENASAGTGINPPVEKKPDPVPEKKPEPVIEKKPDPIPEKKPEPIVEKKQDPVPEKKPDPVPEKKPEPIVEKKPDPVPEKKPEPIVEKKPDPIPEKKPEPVIEKKPDPVPEKKPEQIEKHKKKKKKLVWILLLILLLGGGGTAGFIFKDQLMEMVGMNETTAGNEEKKDESTKEEPKEEPKEETVETPETTEENLAEESTEKADASAEETIEEPVIEKTEEPVVEETPKVQATTSSPGNYYIIVGCYSNQSNADNMISKISAAGMSPVNVGTFNSLIHIAASSASDMQGALQQLSSVRGTFPSAWIMKQ